ncbi:MAG: Inner membrane protein YghQ [Gammaproteobacteria bacterium]|nr:Inner membrane protein YghQ [Gammaproteobacteria bacterium]
MNFGWLLGGRAGAAVLMLTATVLTARALGIDDFGSIVLIHTTALVIRQLCRVKTAEAVIRFGTPLRDQDSGDGWWWRLLAATVRLDLVTALLAALVAAGVNLLSARMFGLDPALQEAAWLYVPALAISGTGTAKGALRVVDRYALLGSLSTIGPAVRLAGVLYAGFVGASPAWYILIWAGSLFVEDIVVLSIAGAVLRPKYSMMIASGLRQAVEIEPRLPGFLKVIYWQSNLDVFPRHIVTLLVGAYFGTSGAGVFRLARDLAEVLGKPVALLRQAIFPDLSRLWQQDARRFLRLTTQVSGAMLAVGSVFVVAALFAGAPLLELLAGPEYRAGATVLALLLGAATLELGGAALRPASYTLGRERAVLKIQGLALVIYLPVFFVLAGPLGLPAAGWAAVAATAFSLGGLTLLIRRTLRSTMDTSAR